MAVLKSKRKASPFEVFHHWYKVRKEVTNILLRDFGYSREKADKQLNRQILNVPAEMQEQYYQRTKNRLDSFDEWFIRDEREYILGCLHYVGRYLFLANDIMPQYMKELEQRRIYQDLAIGYCDELKQELQYTIETLPVDINKYTHIAEMADQEIALIKGWRKSDNRFKKIVT